MKLWMQAAVITSVLMLLFFGYSINKVFSVVYTPEAAYMTPPVVPMPLVRREISLEKLLEKLPEDRQVFRQVFFEIMNLRGVQRNRFGTWLAIFADPKGTLIRMGPGDTYDGVKIESTSENGCVARYGSIERSFNLP